MLKIDLSTKEEVKKFNKTEWVDADTLYYGKPIEWFEKDFVFKAEDDGKIIGSISGYIEQGVLHIKDLIVAKSQRGKGIGRLLMDFAENFSIQNGAHKSHLITGTGWPSESFYLKLGYKRVGELKNHFVHKDFAIYEKSL